MSDDVFDMVNEVAAAETPAETPAAETPAETPAAETPTETKTEPKLEFPVSAQGDELFTAEALATPEGLEKARAWNIAQRKRWLATDTKLDRRSKSLNEAVAKHKRETQAFNAERDQLRSNVQLLRTSADRQTKLAILGQLFGTSGAAAYEELGHAFLAQGGKQPAVPKEIQATIDTLQAKITELEKKTTPDPEEVQRQESQRYWQSQSARVYELASNAEKYPHAAAALEMGVNIPEETLGIVAKYFRDHGVRLTYEQVLAKKEELLAQRFASLQPQKPVPPASGDNGAAVKTPVAGQRLPGQSFTPSQTQGSSIREMTDEERLNELAKDDDFFNSIFG